MKRWVLYHQDQRIGQASSWHKALDVLRRQTGHTYFQVSYLNGYVCVVAGYPAGTDILEGYSIRHEHIN